MLSSGLNWVQEKFDHQRKVIDLKEKYKADCVYDWFQGTEKGVWKSGGICASMVMDWLRRKYLRLRDYDDPKYASSIKTPGSFSIWSKAIDMVFPEGNENRIKLMTRVLEIHNVYSEAWRDHSQRTKKVLEEYFSTHGDYPSTDEFKKSHPDLAAFHFNPNKQAFATAVGQMNDVKKKVPKGFANIVLGNPSMLDLTVSREKFPTLSIEGEVSKLVLETFIDMQGYNEIGAYFSLDFTESAHAIGAYFLSNNNNQKYSNREWIVFDPNFGEYAFIKPGSAILFVSELCNAMYRNDILVIRGSLAAYKS